jgi:hypothetical protein
LADIVLSLVFLSECKFGGKCGLDACGRQNGASRESDLALGESCFKGGCAYFRLFADDA